VIAFLDDDATAEPGWLAALMAPYADLEVAGTGGVAEPRWPTQRPSWFPPEFDWVIGCSYLGLPEVAGPIRNFIGANMSFRKSAFDAAGLFRSDIGRVGTLPLGCEETEFSIRLSSALPGSVLMHVPESRVRHRISADRTEPRYFLRRCFAEGLSKAVVSDSSAIERHQQRDVLLDENAPARSTERAAFCAPGQSACIEHYGIYFCRIRSDGYRIYSGTTRTRSSSGPAAPPLDLTPRDRPPTAVIDAAKKISRFGLWYNKADLDTQSPWVRPLH